MQASSPNAICGGFRLAAVIGFRRSLWLAAHGVLDSAHSRIVQNNGVPPLWPPFCLAFDVTAAAYLTWRPSRVR